MFPVVGRRGGKRNCQLKEPPANEWIDNGHDSTPIFWPNDATRRLVDPTAPRLSRIVDLYRLFHLGCVSGRALFFRQLHLAFLFAGDFRDFDARMDSRDAALVATLD